MADTSTPEFENRTETLPRLALLRRLKRLLHSHWHRADDQQRLLRIIQPGLIGLIDGTISTLAPLFATAYLAGSRAALLVGIASALGAGLSMGISEGLSDTGELTGRGSSLARGLITGLATVIGGSLHSLPFLISSVHLALMIAYCVVGVELIGIAIVRKKFMAIPLTQSLVQVTAAGVIVAAMGAAIGHA